MFLLTIKYKNGYPDQAISRIVVLGNLQKLNYSTHETYAPVLSLTQFRTILALAISKQRILKQGDVKNAFCNGVLPDTEVVVCTPPAGCPQSKPRTLWRLKKTLYGIFRSSLHWYKNISTFFKSIGLENSQNNPCVFTGKLLDNKPPIYIGLYVDDFCFFSESDEVENEFKNLLNTKYTVSFDDQLDWFL